MKLNYLFVLVLASVCIIPTHAFADSKDAFLKKKKEYRAKWESKVNEIYQQLELSPDQQEQLKANRSKYQEKKDALYEKIHQARKDLNTELQQPNIDMDKMQQLHSEIKKLKFAREDLRFESILEVRRILSSEQFQEFMKLKEEWKASFREK